MTNEQLRVLRPIFNKRRESIGLDVVRNADGSETFTPVRLSDDQRGEPVTITKDTPVSEVTRLFTQALKPLS